jgi:hypothetical protein
MDSNILHSYAEVFREAAPLVTVEEIAPRGVVLPGPTK